MSKNKLLSIAAAMLMAFSAVSCSSGKNVKPEPDIPEVNKTAEKVSENSFKRITRYFEQSDITDTDMSYSTPVAADQDKYYYFQGGRDFAYEMPENYEVYCADINGGSVEYSEFDDVINNTFGCIIGIGVFAFSEKLSISGKTITLKDGWQKCLIPAGCFCLLMFLIDVYREYALLSWR